MSSRHRAFAAILAAAALLFGQLAVSAYACPSQAAMAVAEETPTDTGCPDLANANLCDQHCDYGSTSVDSQPHSPAVPDFATLPWRAIATPDLRAVSMVPDWRLARSAAPPPPILFGALRI